MTNKEAIEYLIDPIGKGLAAHEEAIKIAVDAIEKQIPKKSIVDFHSAARYRCPNCNSTVNLYIDSPSFPFCSYCGQSLDCWEEGKNGIKNND